MITTLGYVVPKLLIVTNVIGTTIGVACGVALLFSAGLDLRCVALLSYVITFAACHMYVTRRNQSLTTSPVS